MKERQQLELINKRYNELFERIANKENSTSDKIIKIKEELIEESRFSKS